VKPLYFIEGLDYVMRTEQVMNAKLAQMYRPLRALFALKEQYLMKFGPAYTAVYLSCSLHHLLVNIS